MTPPALRAMLETWPVGRLSIARPRHTPWSIPIVFAPAAGRIWSPVDGKPKRDARPARIKHVEREGRGTLLLDEYRADWEQLWWVRLTVAATVVYLEASRAEEHAGARALRQKYPQYQGGTDLFRGPPTLLEMCVADTTAWSARGPDWLERRFSGPDVPARGPRG